MNLNEIIKLRNRGLSVFPVSKETKTPIVKWDRLQDELPSLTEVQEWFSVNNWSVGIATGPVSGLLLLDFDFKHPEAKEFYESHSFPLTWKERTKSGGIHLYFRWIPTLNEKQTNTTGKICPGVDTKGYGGYSKITPSEGYSWIIPPHVTPLAVPPTWLVENLLPSKGQFITKDACLPIGIQGDKSIQNRSWLTNSLNEIKEGNRNESFTKIAGSLRARGYSSDDIFNLLRSKASEVSFGERELQTVCDSVGKYESTHVVEGNADSIETFLENVETVEWICEPIIAKRTIGFTAGLPETMKTWLMIDLAIECAKGGGMWLNRFPVNAARVLFIDQERFKGETQRRFRAVLSAKNIRAKDIKDSLFVRCGTTTRIDLQHSFDAFRKEIADLRPDLVVVDSFATFHTKDENSRQAIQEVLERIKQIRTEFGCTFIFIHHENKFAFRAKEEQRDPSIAEMAGSVALPAAAEFVLTVRRQDSESSFVYHTKSTLAATVQPFLVKVTDIDESKSKIQVEAF